MVQARQQGDCDADTKERRDGGARMPRSALTFEDAIRNGRASVMSKQRLKVVQRDLFEQLEQMPLL